jgi:hypothetical protein
VLEILEQKGEDGKGALLAKVYAFKINIYGWLVQLWRCMLEDELVDQISNLLCCVDDLHLDVSYTKFRN